MDGVRHLRTELMMRVKLARPKDVADLGAGLPRPEAPARDRLRDFIERQDPRHESLDWF